MDYKFKFPTIIVVFIAILGGFLYSCQEESSEDTASANLPYLSFNNYPGTAISDLSENDLNALISAFKRIDLKKENGLYRIDTKSATQINISDNLFLYFEDLIEKNNNRILKEGSNFALAPRTRNGGENGNSSNDCVSVAIVKIAKSMHYSMSLSEVKKWVESKYGTNGVPSSKISEVLNHYFVYESVSIREGFTPPSGRQVFVVMKGRGNEGHAARYMGCNNGLVLCHDGTVGELSQVTHAYMIKGIK